MKEFFNSLTFRIGAIVILVEIVTLLVMGLTYVSRFHDQIDAKLLLSSELTGKLIASGKLNKDAVTDRRLIQTLIGQELIDGIVFDRHLKVISSLNPLHKGKHLRDLITLKPEWFEPRPVDNVTEEYRDEHRYYLVSIVPMLAYDGITPIFYTYTKINTNQASKEKSYITRLFLTGSVIAVFITSLVLIILFRHLISARVRETKNVLQRVEQNDFCARIKVNDVGDELSVLQDQVNTMVTVLGKSFKSLEEEIAERKQADNKLTYQASHDALTELVNRGEFERRAIQSIKRVSNSSEEHALCYMDLDQFKVVNDTCGHIAGDKLLRQLSSLLLQVVRKGDTLARLGGDEFGVLMQHCKSEDALRVATSLQDIVQNFQFTWDSYNFRVGVSIGLVSINKTTTDLTQLMKDADTACYMAKDKGGNRIHVYHADDAEISQRYGEMQWVVRLNQALEEDRLCLFAQPIESLNSSNDLHYELLIRMLDEHDDIIPPGAFLPAAERYNIISSIDRWVIEHSLSSFRRYPRFMEQVNFCSINLSGQSLGEENMLDFIIKQLEFNGIDGSKICFEITETAAISNIVMAEKFIEKLKEKGCKFALDDFGSGLSSFGYLKNLAVDYLKIDGLFVKDIVVDPIDRAMVKSINEIGHVMKMNTIAEFVESDEIKSMLKEIGVDYVQGYNIGKPQPFQEVLEFSKNIIKFEQKK